MLYSKNPFGDEVNKRSPLYIGLMALRFTALFLIAFLLLSPFIKTSSRKVQKPVIVLALDNTESVTANKDSLFYTYIYSFICRSLLDYLINFYLSSLR